MKTMKTKIIAIALVIVMMLGVMPISVFAADSDLIIAVDQKTALAGSTVTININFTNNPGISSTKLKVAYDDSILTLDSVSYNSELGGQSIQPQTLESPVTLTWVSPFANYSADNTFATLTFTVAEDAKANKIANISITYDPNDIYNMDETNIDCSVKNGSVTVVKGVPGDINGDQLCNNKDITRMFQYLAGWEVYVNTPMLDTNGDGSVNNKDLTRLFQYLADWEVEIFPPIEIDPDECVHKLESIPANAPLCEKNGNISYWYCSLCEKYFSNANATTEIILEDTIIPYTGHTVVIDPAIEPTYDSTGLTEGSHCSACSKVLVPQEEIPVLPKNYYTIKYEADYNDSYLETLDFSSQIPTDARYSSEDGLYELPILEVDGYDFIGWFDGSSSLANKVTEIPAGSKGNRTLYAKWEVRQYTITFSSEYISVNAITNHQVNKETELPSADTMKLYGYRWLGWSDENGELYTTTYPTGKAGNVTLHANWQSYRNQAIPVDKLGEPIIIEDETAGTYNFVYEIGTIKNVPVLEVADYGKLIPGQPSETVTQTNSVSLVDETAKTFAETVSSATTKTSTWTLSNEWNTISSVSESHASEMGINKEEINYDFTSKTNNLSLTTDMGESTSETVNWGVNAKVYGKYGTETGAEAKFPVECINVGVSAKVKTEVGGEIGGYYDKTTVNDSYWNTSRSYDDSINTVNSKTTTSSLSQRISDVYNYSTTTSQGGSQSSGEAVTIGETASNEYSSLIAYTTDKLTAETVTTTYTAELEGWWRKVLVSDMHVFGVVSYDIETSTYSVYTYNVLDGNTTMYTDFSMTSGDYNDFETGVIPFEVPYSVNEYISYSLGYTNGLEIDRDTGIIAGYTGDAAHIHIPDYITIDNGDETYTAIKVTGIKDGLFQNDTNISSVRLGKYITEIPDNAFNGCSSLKTIEYEALNKIGENAFADCTSLEKFVVNTSITEIGNNAFKNVPELLIYAANSNIVKSSVNTGAKSLSIYLRNLSDELKDTTLVIPAITDNFALYGRNNNSVAVEYNNVVIESNASATTINGMIFVNNKNTPLKLSSEIVTFAQVTVKDAQGIALILTADNTNLYLMDKNSFSTVSTNPIICKGIVLDKAPNTNTTTSLVAQGGTLLYCNNFTDKNNLFIGNQEQISEVSFEQLLNDSLPWILVSDMPAGATVINQKWTYDLQTNAPVSDENYSLYETTSDWGEYGTWSTWSDTVATPSDSRKVETQKVKYGTKTQYRYERWCSQASGGGTAWCNQAGGGNYYEQTIWLDSKLPHQSTDGGVKEYGRGYSASGVQGAGRDLYWYNEEYQVVDLYKTQYRYCDRSLIYTYHYDVTSATEITPESASGTDVISNVQKWVKYVTK